MLTTCGFCFTPIQDAQSHIPGIGVFHPKCVDEAMAEGGEKKVRAKILFIDQGNRNGMLFDRQREGKITFPEMDFTTDFRNPREGLSYLRSAKFFYDFIFLDAPRAEDLKDHVDAILTMEDRKIPRGVFFYGFLTPSEKKSVESFCTHLQLKKGIDARIIPIHELCFSLIQEKTLPGVVEVELTS